MLAANVVLSEFMAVNSATQVDQDGAFSDWIEVRNLGDAPQDLANWHLTATPGVPDQWTLPAVSLDPGAALVVFASGKNRTNPASELHTNFDLPESGGYLALTRPDLSVVNAFGPNYPVQVSDVSFGIGTVERSETVLATGAAARYRVPGASGDLPASWTSAGFNDATWTAVVTGIGFDTEPASPPYPSVVLADSPIHYYRFEETSTVVPARDEIGPGANGAQPGTYTGGITLGQGSASESLGNAARFNGASGTYVNLGAPFHPGSSTTVEAWVRLDTAANKPFHAIVARWDGSFELDVNQDAGAGNFVTRSGGNTFGQAATASFTFGQWHHMVGVFDAATSTTTVYLDGVQGSSQVTTGGLQNAGSTLYIGATRDGAGSGFNWTGLIDEVAFYNRALSSAEILEHYEAGTGNTTAVDFTSHIATNVESTMRGVNSSVAIRVPFTTANPGAIDRLALRMKYDDGFVAYLNGQEVARRNAPAGPPVWNSAATSEHTNSAAIVFEEIDISAARSLLVAGAGANVLAIHGLNIAAANQDFLIVPEVTAIDEEHFDVGGPGQYFDFPTLGGENSQSSAGVPSIDHVSITEVLTLNDGILVDEDGDESDWIELHNAGPFAVDLDNSYLTNDPLDPTGWRFPRGSVVSPGGHLVVFASGKDRNRGQLHTSFRLDSEGEYLALVKADGATVVSQFSPAYPPQLPNVTYGRPATSTTHSLIAPGASARVRVPTQAADMPANWNQTAYDDSAWPAATTGIGFDTDGGGSYAAAILADGPVHYWRLEESSTAQPALDQGVPGGNNGMFIGGVSIGEPSVGALLGSAARFDGVETAPLGSRIDVGSFHAGASVTIEAWVKLDPSATKPLHTVASRWDGSWSLDVINSTKRGSFVVRNDTNQLGSAQTAAALVPGQWHHLVGVFAGGVITVYLDGVAGASVNRGGTLRNAGPSPDRVLIGASRTGSTPGSNNWTGHIDEVAVYGTALSPARIAQHYAEAISANLDLSSAISTSVGAAMHNVNSLALVRAPFTVANPAALDELTLRMKYDDGFVAYLNGQEVARRNAPGNSGDALTFNASAPTTRPDNLALAGESIDLSPHLGLLQPGNNLLAIAGLNRAAADGDFLLAPELTAVDTGNYAAGAPNRYFVTPTPGAFNSTGALDRGPIISGVSHVPAAPTDAQDLVVTAQITNLSAATASVSLRYRVMFAGEASVAMMDNGSAPDAIAGDGIFTGVIPASAYAAGEMVRYYVTAVDTAGNPSRWPLFPDPGGSAQYLGTVVIDPAVTSPLPIFQWFVQDTAAADNPNQTGTRASVYYLGEFYDNVFVRTRGATAVSYPKRPYKFDFNKGHYFRFLPDAPRVDEINVNSTFQDKAYVRAPLAFETYRAAGVPASDAFNLRVERNGGFFSVAVMVEQVDAEFLERRGLDPEGAMYKFVSFNGITSSTVNVEKKTRRDEPNADLQAVVNGLALASAIRANFVLDNFDIAEVVNLLAAGILFQDFDRTIKNYYLYRDTNGDGEWSVFAWDKDLTFGLQGLTTDLVQGNNDAPTAGIAFVGHPLFGTTDRNCCGVNNLMDAIYDTPLLRELVMRRLRTLMDEFLLPPGTPVDQLHYERRLDELFPTLEADAALDRARWGAGFGANQSLATAMNIIKSNYLAQRRVHLYQTHNIDNLPGGMLTRILPARAPATAFVPTDDSLGLTWTQPDFNDAAWLDGTTGVGYDTAPDYDGVIGIDVQAQMLDARPAVYVRVPFDVPDPTALPNLILRMQYDDGFVAYLNGVKVAEINAPPAPTASSVASALHEAAVGSFEDFDISAFRSALVTGRNVLAIHGLNQAVGSSDMIVLPELATGITTGYAQAAGIPHAQVGNPAIQFGAIEVSPASRNQDEEYIQLTNPNDTAVDISGWKLTGGVAYTFPPGTIIPRNGSLFVSPNVKAFRARAAGPSGGQGLIVAGAYTGHLSSFGETLNLLSADDSIIATTTTPNMPSDAQKFLRITEIMYHPAAPTSAESALGHTDRDDFEYIELTNISSGPSAVTLDLTGVRFTNGVDFDFTGSQITSLAPGAHVLVVRDSAALVARYGDPLPIAGEFTAGTGLSNGGEQVKLDDLEGGTIHQFDYEDDWYLQTDGSGFSLVVVDPFAPQENWDGKSGWRASDGFRGSPGLIDPQPGDTGGDRRVDLTDLATIQAHLGLSSGATRGDGDLDDDDAVSRSDVAILAMNLGQHHPTQSPGASPAVPAALRASRSTTVRDPDLASADSLRPGPLRSRPTPARRIAATRFTSEAVDQAIDQLSDDLFSSTKSMHRQRE
jgi:hypothetical protein